MKSSCLDECPLPTLTNAYEASTRSYTVHKYTVGLCAIRGIRCTGRNRTVRCCPRTTRIGLSPPQGCAHPSFTSTTFSSYSNNVVNQSASCMRVSSSRYSLARSSAFRCIAATLTVLMNFTSERVMRACDVEAALASSRYALYRNFRTSRSASASASVPAPNCEAAFVRLMR